MQRFERLTGTAAPLMEENVDTDIIFPARFLLITARDGLGRYAFHDRRFAADGSEIADFILNRQPWRAAPILIAGANFGSGSSREQAVWALLGHGIRCIISPGFGEIFYGNCFRNGVLPIILPEPIVTQIAQEAAKGKRFDVDLGEQKIIIDGGDPFYFAISEERKRALLNGWDETAIILNTQSEAIGKFEEQQRQVQPWLYEAT